MANSASLDPPTERAETQTGRSQMAMVQREDDIYRAVCTVSTPYCKCTGFLGRFKLDINGSRQEIKGIFTVQHCLINENQKNLLKRYPLDGKIVLKFDYICEFQREDKTHTLEKSDIAYYFTCHIMDVAFIQLTDVCIDEIEKVCGSGRLFLTLKSNENECVDHFKREQTLCLLHHLQGEVPMSKTTGKVVRSEHGMNLLHHIDTFIGSCGGPLCSADLEVFGMHKAGVEYDDTNPKNNYNIAVSMPFVVSAISKCFSIQVHVKEAPKELQKVTDPNLLKHKPFANGDIYVYNDLIWFVKTHYEWFWTINYPFDPNFNVQLKWLPVSVDEKYMPDEYKQIIISLCN